MKPMTDAERQQARSEAVRTIKLSETSNLVRRMADAMIRYHGEYFCIIGGEKVRVIAD